MLHSSTTSILFPPFHSFIPSFLHPFILSILSRCSLLLTPHFSLRSCALDPLSFTDTRTLLHSCPLTTIITTNTTTTTITTKTVLLSILLLLLHLLIHSLTLLSDTLTRAPRPHMVVVVVVLVVIVVVVFCRYCGSLALHSLHVPLSPLLPFFHYRICPVLHLQHPAVIISLSLIIILLLHILASDIHI